MPRPIPFLEFLDRHWRDAAAGLEEALPLGCLLDAVNPTRSSQRAAHVVPLLRDDGGAGPVVVGRAPDCDVVLTSPSVSRRHAAFELRGGELLLSDAGSSTGTFVGSKRLAAGEAAPLAADGASELWFGALGSFHFGPRALGDYLRRILEAPAGTSRYSKQDAQDGDTDRLAKLAARAVRAEGRSEPGLNETWRPHRPGAPTPAEEARQEDAWCRGLTAILELGRAVHGIHAVLDLDDRAVCLYDADRDAGGVAAALQGLEGRRAGIARVEVTLRSSRAPVVVFERR